MAHFHTRQKAISRGKYNTVDACAYRAGTQLYCQQTGQVFDYQNKPVQRVEILLPKDAPEWAQKLQQLVKEDRQKGMQYLSDLVESAEKRKDARVYREFEFALPCELTREQNYELANELIQDQACSKGMLAIQSFHMDVDKETGQEKPHCHTLLLTRRLTDEGLSHKKEREWNKREFHQTLFENVAAYTNFHLKKHGINKTIDYRSYKERGIHLEPQPKRGRNVREMEYRGQKTDKQSEFDVIKLRNMHRILRDPEQVLEIATKSQSTFVWEDVQKVLIRYFDDAEAFSKIENRLLNSKELIYLREEGENTKAVYTTKSIAKVETDLVRLARNMGETQAHEVHTSIRDEIIEEHNNQIKAQGFDGFSKDQIDAIHHMTESKQLSCVVGYAGAGKTTALKTVKQIYETHGYNVYGMAPTGRAAQNLEEEGIQSQTLDKFLGNFKEGRQQFRQKTVVILDEAGMVDARKFSDFLSAMDYLGCKVITVGDGAQLQAVQAGPAFRLVTGSLETVRLETIVRQKQEWQREATKLFGQQKTREALELYEQHGAFNFVSEQKIQPNTLENTVQAFLVSRRITGNIWYAMLKDCGLEAGKPLDWKKINAHQDAEIWSEWKEERNKILNNIQKDLNVHIPYLEKYNVDPEILKMHHVPDYKFDGSQRKNICDLRAETKKELATSWHQFRNDNPDKTSIVLSYSNKDAEDLSAQIRQTLKEQGFIERQEKIYTVVSEERDDFDKVIKHKRDRAFSIGDRLLFTKNNTAMGVSNGTLGVVTELSKQNIKVKPDGKDQEISFAPKLYPHFDHGWASTTHKAQGVTVDQTFKLASYEENRNLAYVGKTRHRDDMKVFCSRNDFWRDEKVIDRLSQSAEKLSSLDYMNADQLLTQMREDSYGMRVSTKIKDFTAATQYVGGRLWKDIQGYIFQKEKDLIAPVVHEMKREWTEQERAKGILENAGEEKPLNRVEAPMPLSKEVLTNISTSKEPQRTKENILPEKNIQQEGKRAVPVTAYLETKVDHPQQTRPSYKKYDIDKLSQYLKDDVKTLATHLLGDENKHLSSHKELRFGQKGSLVVTLQGARQGQWFDHEAGEGGNMFKLIEREHRCDFKQALEIANNWTKGAAEVYVERLHEKQPSTERSEAVELAQKQERTEKAYARSVPIEGTLGETYLRQHRQIKTAELAGDIRFMDGIKSGDHKYPAVVVFARNGAGDLTGSQAIFLDPETGNKVSSDQLEVRKRSYGQIKGSTLTVQTAQSGHAPLYVAEGLETALSLKEAGIEGNIVCTMGSSNLKNVSVQEGQQVILCADQDGKNTASEKAIQSAKESLENKGAEVLVLKPDKALAQDAEGKLIKGYDFNDVLKDYSAGMVRILFEELQEKTSAHEYKSSGSLTSETAIEEKETPVKKEAQSTPEVKNDTGAESIKDPAKERDYLFAERASALRCQLDRIDNFEKYHPGCREKLQEMIVEFEKDKSFFKELQVRRDKLFERVESFQEQQREYGKDKGFEMSL
jgi:Ti-type conjugative transfer relaxase TraA